jgi:hypothetical protein
LRNKVPRRRELSGHLVFRPVACRASVARREKESGNAWRDSLARGGFAGKTDFAQTLFS